MYGRLYHYIEQTLAGIANRNHGTIPPAEPEGESGPDHAPGSILIGHERAVPWKPNRRIPQAPVYLTEAELGKHLVLHARTGAGKSVCLLHLSNDWLSAGRGMIVFDPDGSQAPQIVALLSRHETPDSLHDRLLYIDLDEEDWVVPLDVLASADESSALLLLDAIETQWGSALGPVVGRSLRAALFAGVQATPSLTLGDLPLLYQSAPLRQRVVPNASAATARFWEEYEQLSPEQQKAYRDPVTNRLEAWLAASAIAAMLTYPRGLNFRDLFTKRPDLCVVVNLATRRAAGASRLLASLLWAQIMSQLMHPDRVSDGSKPILIVADEYQNLASEEALMTCLAEARKYKLALCLASQVFSRVSKPLRDSILGNCFCTFAFSSGDTGDFAPYVHFEGDPLPKADIATFLARQKVGESVLIRPGMHSLAIKHLPPPDLARIKPETVRALIEASYQAYALPKAQAQDEIRERQAKLTESLVQPAQTGQSLQDAFQSPAVKSALDDKPVARVRKKPLLAPEGENTDV